MATIKVPDYRKLIETGFDIIGKDGQRQPFLLNLVQLEYLMDLSAKTPTLAGIRDNVLKARQEGFSALIDAIIVCDFLLSENIGAQIISHKKEETDILMKRVNFFLDSWLEKRGRSRKDLLKTDSTDYLENKINGSYIFIGTAGAKTLGRGGTLQNIHWSEVGFYPNTEILSAERLVSAAEQQVMTGIGKIFRESTGNMFGDFYHQECERARKGESTFDFHFYPWFKNPEYRTPLESAFNPTEEEQRLMFKYSLTPEQVMWYRRKALEFKTRALFLREYPSEMDEAFLASGAAYFNADSLKAYMDKVVDPIKMGSLAYDGGFI